MHFFLGALRVKTLLHKKLKLIVKTLSLSCVLFAERCLLPHSCALNADLVSKFVKNLKKYIHDVRKASVIFVVHIRNK